ncbi:hypothetical protein Lesp01_79520 [Lentzea sp. NBRC 102530]|nr:hypothetical protein Lesp01_79520 [Lentzea sp. NBRC 102530]
MDVDEVDAVNTDVDDIDHVNLGIEAVNVEVDDIDDIDDVRLIPARHRAGRPPGVAAVTSTTPADWPST